MQKTKKLVVMVMLLALVAQPIQGKAAAVLDEDADAIGIEYGISPMSQNTAGGLISLIIDPKTGATECAATVTGYRGTTKISGTLKLLKGSVSSTNVYKSWDVLSNSYALDVCKTCYILTKGTYTLVISVNVVCNGTREKITKSITRTY